MRAFTTTAALFPLNHAFPFCRWDVRWTRTSTLFVPQLVAIHQEKSCRIQFPALVGLSDRRTLGSYNNGFDFTHVYQPKHRNQDLAARLLETRSLPFPERLVTPLLATLAVHDPSGPCVTPSIQPWEKQRPQSKTLFTTDTGRRGWHGRVGKNFGHQALRRGCCGVGGGSVLRVRGDVEARACPGVFRGRVPSVSWRGREAVKWWTLSICSLRPILFLAVFSLLLRHLLQCFALFVLPRICKEETIHTRCSGEEKETIGIVVESSAVVCVPESGQGIHL